MQYADRSQADCRGRLRSDAEGYYGYRAVVPVAYPIPGDVSAQKCVVYVYGSDHITGPGWGVTAYAQPTQHAAKPLAHDD